jgi:hypothetical protein
MSPSLSLLVLPYKLSFFPSSFGEYGGQYENNTMQQVNCKLMKMGLRGIFILLTSGDNGRRKRERKSKGEREGGRRN